MIDWKPIKSAPKDGRGILGYISKDWIEGVFWNGEQWCWMSDGDSPSQYDKNKPKYWAEINHPEEE